MRAENIDCDPARGQVFFAGTGLMRYKSEIMDESAVLRSVTRITHEIIERNRGTDKLLLIGIRRRGLPLARMIADNIKRFEGVDVPVGDIDVTLYRDDLSETVPLPSAGSTFFPCAPDGMCVVLVDDVLYTGRTVRAAIEGIFAHGRPAAIQLAVLVDRGHRELPIRPDFVGRNIPTSRGELVSVQVPEIDGELCVKLFEL